MLIILQSHTGETVADIRTKSMSCETKINVSFIPLRAWRKECYPLLAFWNGGSWSWTKRVSISWVGYDRTSDDLPLCCDHIQNIVILHFHGNEFKTLDW